MESIPEDFLKIYSKLSSLILVSLWSITLCAAEFSEPTIKMGPTLHFNGIDALTKTWQVSALYLLKKTKINHPVLIFNDEGKKEVALGIVIGSLFGYDYVKYNMAIHRTDMRQKIEYNLQYEKNIYSYYVPAIGQNINILYHSCNGYQSEEDREKVGGIAPMWQEINRRHNEQPFELQLGGGDQLYADGLVNRPSEGAQEPSKGRTFGVFALPSILKWIKDKKHLHTAPFTQEMVEEVTQFYFDHYVRHYNSDEFRSTMASVPSLVQPDDHDFYDGCGSYPPELQNSPVMAGIRAIGAYFAFTIQHHLNYAEVAVDEFSKAKTHSYLHVIDDGKLAILGVDTRSERSADQVVSEKTWDKLFADLEKLGPDTKHLIVMLGIPVIYASTNSLDKAFKVSEAIKPVDTVVSLIPDIKNAFGLFELADDCRDGWSHKAHKKERNEVIARFQAFANKMGIRVTIISGDVHLGGVGKIFHHDRGIDDCSENAIWQIISSPVGNRPVGKKTACLIGKVACKEKKIKNDCRMCLYKIHENNNGEDVPLLIKERNFAVLKLLPDNYLEIELSAESKEYKAHTIYQFTIPPTPCKHVTK